jgi:triosephosphate isomerase
MSKKLIIANWKMNPASSKEAEKLFSQIAKGVSHVKKTEIVVCPPYIYEPALKKISRKIILGAQDAFPGDVGAFTGEVSGDMLYNLGMRYVILGHSERRALGEDNVLINKKLRGAIASGLRPILCVGENTRDESHGYFNIVKSQLEECLAGISKNSIDKIIVAYEPVWALSTTADRKDATPADSMEMIIFLRKALVDKFGKDGTKVKMIYGGSVSEKNAGDFLVHGGVEGLLPGKASLDPKKFLKIVEIAERL